MKTQLIILLAFSFLFANAECNRETPLMHAAAQANVREMQNLIQSGADVSASAHVDFPHAGFPVLRYAIDSGSVEAVELLLAHGANVHAITESPLIVSTLETKANVRNLSLLSHAIRSKASSAIIKTLLAYGADIQGNPTCAGDWSALMIASFVGYTKAVEMLLAAGADKTIINSMDCKTAIDYAKEQGHLEIVQLLS